MDSIPRSNTAPLANEDWIQSAPSTNPIKSWGERLLPFIFAAMENCWVAAIFIGLVSLHIAGLTEPPMPFWSPFILIVAAHQLTHYLDRRGLRRADLPDAELRTTRPETFFFFGMMTLLTLCIIWISLYASSHFLLDPRWLITMLNDTAPFHARSGNITSIALLSIYFCWRGVQLTRQTIEPTTVYRMILLGLGIFATVSILRTIIAGRGHSDDSPLLLFIPLFVACSLFAHALAHAADKRRSNPDGVQGGATAQERSLATIIMTVTIGLIVTAISIGFLVNPTFLAQLMDPVGQAYNGFVAVIAQLLVWLFTPLFWLLNSSKRTQSTTGDQAKGHLPQGGHHDMNDQTNPFFDLLAHIISIAVPVLILAGLIALIWIYLRRRQRLQPKKRGTDIHESLWSWQLLWEQFKTMLLALWNWLLRKKTTAPAEIETELIEKEPLIRSVRELYRAFLKWAALRGYARQRDETPYEFKQRLDAYIAQAEPELRAVTEAYAATRYGGIIPDEIEVGRIREQWQRLQQKFPQQP